MPLIGSPLLANQNTSSETLYAASDSFPESIFALDPFSGAVEWRDNLSSNQIVDIGGSIGNTGMAVGDGLLVAGISDQSNNRWLYAFNASTGAYVWRVAVDNDMETTPVVINGIVYMGTFAGTLYAINDSSGTIAWSIPDASYNIGTSPFGAYANGIIYTGVGTNFDALNATTGAVIWSVQDNLFPPVIMVGNTLYSNDGFGGVIALNTSDGSTIWDKQLSGFNLFAQQAANGAVYGSASDINNNTSVFALDGSTGNLLWRTAVSAQIEYLTVTSDTLYFGTSDGYMYSLNAGDGSVNWKFQAVSAPVLGPYIVVDTSSSITAIFAAYTGSSLYVYGVDPTSGAQIWVTQLDITGGYIPGIAMNNVLNGPSIARSATARGQPRCHVAGCAGE